MDVNDVTIYPRSAWGARHREEQYEVPKASGVAVHHSVTTTLSENATFAQEVAEMRKIEEIGHTRFGYTVSYNVVIFPSGRAYQGCPFNKRGQHTGDNNSKVRSICFAGNYETYEPTQAQLQKAQNLIVHGKGKWWTKNNFVKGHRDYVNTACPGKNVYKHLPFLRKGVKPVPTIPSKPATERVTVNVNMPVVDFRSAESRPIRGRGVTLVQTLLVFAGYNIGRAGIDGIGGAATKKAVGQFQTATKTGRGNGPDYVVGEKSWKELIGGWQG